MSVDVDAMVTEVVLLVKNALGPVLERIAAMEARMAIMGDLRDRLIVVETKAAQPPPMAPPPDLPAPVDLTPVLERMAATYARLETIGDLRDRLIVVETKAAQPAPVILSSEPVEPADLSPLLERIAAAEARLSVLGDLRDRVVTVETKAAIPPAPQDLSDVHARMQGMDSRHEVAIVLAINETTKKFAEKLAVLSDRVVVVETKAAHQPVVTPIVEPPPPVDLSPMLERIAAAEARLDTLGDLRDRVVTVETKASQPVPVPAVIDPPLPVDLSPVFERLSAAETRLSVLGDLRDRVVTVETKAAQPVPEPTPVDLSPVLERLSTVELRLEMKAAETTPILAAISDLTKEATTLRERIAVAEVRALAPGPSGKDGTNGLNGKDGADGLGFDDLATVQEADRSFTIKAIRGDRVKTIGTAIFPGIPIQRGVYLDGKSYEAGDVVTWAGSQWSCNEDTTVKPGDGQKAWTLIVKRGRDGKDGRDADPGLPVVSVGKR